ncbi:phosphate signaling complex protein PhoU [Alkalicoccus halolimnae]|uniref:Phosphate-specific transport system accessory protein PhoU n=1 Tax=Alkalicoccus halolimnae TaxID=1667239 RepID=A0A5C7FIA8_9BACI|nr:phosphate signaling complex protein PhoU [Alkalicoccus halolimnae]TXF85859.1 phosphate signaling complex protein PhoU [Alkalicoccus halolimnae]
MIRTQFLSELERLKQEIFHLGKDVEKTFTRTAEAMSDYQTGVLHEIIEADENINEQELNINEEATLMIAKQQPVASDLRHIIVCLKVSSDLERMGDLSVDMAKAFLHMPSHDAFKHYKDELAVFEEKVRYMITHVMAAYDELNVLKAQQIAALDDEVDEAYGAFVKELFRSDFTADQIAQLAFIARYMERIGDYCTNIAEWIIYEVNGKRFDLN